jgi:hypothetical protein
MTLLELGSIFGAVGGAIGLGCLLSSQGALPAIAGVVGGAAAGWVIGPFVMLAFVLLCLALEEGPRAALDFLRRRPRR